MTETARNTAPQAHYPNVEPNPDFAKIEQKILAHWQSTHAFEQSVQNRSNADEFVFYDGPPFANGLPHYGHLLTGYVKDTFARYQTMQGKRVERRFGWDCHGLPAEMGAEKELQISGRKAIEEFGIDKFNTHCRSSVMKYAGEWETYVNRQGRWVDFAGDYKTMDTNFMESVIWAFKQLYDKGLIYQSHRVMPYSWAAETPLSNFETKLDNSYRNKIDKAVTVKFKLRTRPKGAPEAKNYYILAWTTTPWTLPSNLALAAASKLEYNCEMIDGDCHISQHESENISAVLKGSELIGLEYEPLFPYFANHPNAFRILDGSSFIEEGSGTGIVHMSPGFGEDDQRVCAENGIEVVVPVDEKGRYTDEIYDLPRSFASQGDVLLESERLQFKAFTQNDFAHYQYMEADPQITSKMAFGQLSAQRQAEDFQRLLDNQARYGYTVWAVYRKSDGAFIGRAGFDHRDFNQPKFEPSRPELRYALLGDYWGQGYALEAGRALMQWAAAKFGDVTVDAGSFDNAASMRILSKLGFTKQADVVFNATAIDYYAAPLAPWQVAPLSLKGMNVVAQTQGQCADEPYTLEQTAKYGLVNLRIINWLKLQGALVKQEDYNHNYPHCWRTDTPLIYRAMPSWYVEVTKIRDKAVEMNRQINWIPEHIGARPNGTYASHCPRLEHLAQPLLGHSHPHLGAAR